VNYDTVERSQAHRLVIPLLAMSIDDSLPTDLASTHALIIAQREALSAAEQRAAAAESEAQYRALLIENLKFTIRKTRSVRPILGTWCAARSARAATGRFGDGCGASGGRDPNGSRGASEKITVPSFERRKPARRPLPEHLPRERIVHPAPSACPCCGGATLRKIGEDVTETPDLIPRQWKAVQHVREKFSCRACEAISQPPAPSHPIARDG
jgi:transposase